MNCIVITTSEDQAKSLKQSLGGKWNNKDFYGYKHQQFDNVEWYWVINGKNISGSSGLLSINNTMNNYPYFPVYTYIQYVEITGLKRDTKDKLMEDIAAMGIRSTHSTHKVNALVQRAKKLLNNCPV